MEVQAMTNIAIRPARPSDCEAVALLLKRAGLPIDDIDSCLHGFHVAVADDKVVGTVGVEVFHDIGLLRSLAVDSEQRNLQIGGKLVKTALQSARTAGAKILYLLTTTAAGYFAKRGFGQTDRNAIPSAIQTHQQFTSLCPSTATVMKMSL